MIRDLAKWKRLTETYTRNKLGVIDYFEEILYQAHDNYLEYWHYKLKEKKQTK